MAQKFTLKLEKKMKCSKCGHASKRIKGSVVFESKVVGKITVPNLEMDHCKNCKSQFLYPGECEKLSEYVILKESDRVGLESFQSFVTEGEAAKILENTKQAFNKNKKIRNGSILFARKEGRRYFLKESVEQFKRLGDGRFRLALNKSIPSLKTVTKLIRK